MPVTSLDVDDLLFGLSEGDSGLKLRTVLQPVAIVQPEASMTAAGRSHRH